MSVRAIAVVLVLGIGILAYVGWKKNQAAPPGAMPGTEAPSGDATSPGMPGGTVMPPAATPDPGLAWSAPSRWQKQPDRAMRLATYAIPKTGGDSDDAACAMYYFGPGQGGGVEANIERWVGEFENAMPARQTDQNVGGLKVSRVEVSGTYLAHGGNMEVQGKKPGWKLLGAIVDGPMGAVFIKLTGPVKTVDAARKDFDAMIASMHKK
jgi:hypothetical protein